LEDISVIKKSFKSWDFDEFATLLKNANVENKLLDSGAFIGNVNLVSTRRVVVSHFSMNRKIVQEGAGIPGFITFVIWEPRYFLNWRNHIMEKGTIGILWKNEHHSITGAGMNGFPVTVEENFFLDRCNNNGYPEIADMLKRKEIIQVSESALQEIRKIVFSASHVNTLDDLHVFEVLETKLVNLLILSLAQASTDKYKMDLSSSKFDTAIDYIHECLNELTSMSQICENAKIPERTLRRLFQEKLTTSQSSYVKKLRLNAVRKNLKISLGLRTVSEVAGEYNFWHMGQFSKDYKDIFDELPSETLASGK